MGNRNLRSALMMALPLLAVSAGGAAAPAGAEEAPDELFETIAALDAAFFEAYNTCDLEKSRSMLAEDLEFYHDLDGLISGPAPLLEALERNICGKVRRELVPGTMEVHRLQGYGALQTGVHLFHHPGREEIDGVGQGRFIHIWARDGDAWTLERAVSYDHRPFEGPSVDAPRAHEKALPGAAEDVSPILVGTTAPDGALKTADGLETTLGGLLDGSPGVLVFYRGHW